VYSGFGVGLGDHHDFGLSSRYPYCASAAPHIYHSLIDSPSTRCSSIPLSSFSSSQVHTLLHKSTTYLIVTLTLVYIASFLVFAPFYWAVSEDCGLELDTFGEAVFISLETMTTIGFGVPRDYMDGCGSGMLIVTVQSVFSVLVSAVTIGGFWLRVSRPQTRANSIAFSDKAVVQEIRGALYLMFQVVELRKHQLTEAKVRCYTLSQRPSLGMAAMRLHRPDDQLGSMLLLSLPAVVVHRIDNWSPLSPTPAGLAAATAAANAEMLENAEGGGSRPSGARVGRNSQRGSGVASGAASGQLGESVGPSGPGARVGAGVGGGGGAAAAAGAAGAGGEEATAPHHHDPSVSFLFPDVAQRISDVESGNREARGAASDPTFAGHHSTGAPGVPGPGGPGGAGGGKHFGALALDARDMAAKRRAVAEWLQASGAEVLAVVVSRERGKKLVLGRASGRKAGLQAGSLPNTSCGRHDTVLLF